MPATMTPGATLRFYGRTAFNGAPGIREYLAARVPFTAGSMTAQSSPRTTWGTVPAMGIMPDELADLCRDELARAVYVVYSYRTPIAWVLKDQDGQERTVIPPVEYTRTTARHLNLCRAHLAPHGYDETPEHPKGPGYDW
ncbi:hypothetical protein [Actinomadura fulvescens]